VASPEANLARGPARGKDLTFVGTRHAVRGWQSRTAGIGRAANRPLPGGQWPPTGRGQPQPFECLPMAGRCRSRTRAVFLWAAGPQALTGFSRPAAGHGTLREVAEGFRGGRTGVISVGARTQRPAGRGSRGLRRHAPHRRRAVRLEFSSQLVRVDPSVTYIDNIHDDAACRRAWISPRPVSDGGPCARSSRAGGRSTNRRVSALPGIDPCRHECRTGSVPARYGRI
jgi:hypothetical protein